MCFSGTYRAYSDNFISSAFIVLIETEDLGGAVIAKSYPFLREQLDAKIVIECPLLEEKKLI